MTRIVAVELRKSFDTRSGLWLLASIGLAALLTTGAVIAWAPASEFSYSQFTLAIGVPMSVILPIIAVLSVTAEWSQRSGLTTFTLVPHRGRVLLAKAARSRPRRARRHRRRLRRRRARQPRRDRDRRHRPPCGTRASPTSATSRSATPCCMLVGFTLGALIRNSPGAIVAYMIYAFVAPGLLAFLAFNQAWFRDVRPWVDPKYNQDALLQGGLSGEQWTQLAVTTAVWLVLPLLVAVVNLLRSEVK